MRPSFSSRRRQAGLSLLEVLLAVGLTLLIGALSIDAIRTSSENRQAEAAGEQLKGVGQALNTYISLRYDKITTLTNVGNSCPAIDNTSDSSMAGNGNDPGPRCCTGSPSSTAGAVCTINSDTLRRNGLLPNSFSGYNAYGAKYLYRIRVRQNAPNYIVDGIVFTDQPYVTTGTTPRYDLLGTAMQVAGADSGMTRSVANRVEGLNGAWSDSNFADINTLGLLAYRAGYGTSGYAAYLRLDGSTAMTGDLQLGPDATHRHNIVNVADVGAQTVTLVGTGTDNQANILLSNKGGAVTAISAVTTGAQTGGVSIQNDVGVNVTSSTGWGKTNAGILHAAYDPSKPGGDSLNGFITADRDITASRDLIAQGKVTTTGGVTSHGDVTVDTANSGLVLSGGGGWYQNDSTWIRAKNDQSVQTRGEIRGGIVSIGNAISLTAAPNTACTNSGGTVALAKSSAGNELLQCRNSLWTTLGTTSQVVVGPTITAGGTSTATCPTGTAVTGGGYGLIAYNPIYPNATANAPDTNAPSGNGWVVFAGGAVGNSQFRSYAICSQ